METTERGLLARKLGLRDGIAIAVGTIIGSGIFLVPSAIASQLPSLAAVVAVWVLGGVLSVAGALSLAELASMFPEAGGIYVYLREAYGRSMGFLYAWVALVAGETGGIAGLAVAFGIYLAQIVPLTPMERKIASVALVLALTAGNCYGVETGKWVQNLLTACKLFGIAAMTGVLLARGSAQHIREALLPAGAHSTAAGFGLALIAALWAYQSWHSVAYNAAEFRNPQRDLPRSLIIGALLVMAIYLAANVAYYAVLTPGEIAGSERVAADATTRALGTGAASFLALLILCSVSGASNGILLTAPRATYALAERGDFFRSFARVNLRTRVPVLAIAVQGLWGAVLACLGSFQQIVLYTISIAWVFFAFAVLAVIVLRRKRPDAPRPFRTPLYPLTPLLFVATATAMTINYIVSDPKGSAMAGGVVLIGLPLYAILRKRRGKGPDLEQAPAAAD